MDYNIEVFQSLYPLLRDFTYHYFSYKEMKNMFKVLPGNKSFWAYTCNAHLEMAIIIWCMIFGSDSNQTHWKKLNLEGSTFRKYFLDELMMSFDTWKKYRDEFVEFRNRYVAHRDLNNEVPVPILEIAYKMIILLELWVRKQIEPDYIDCPPLKQLSESYRTDIDNTLKIVVRYSKSTCPLSLLFHRKQ